VTAQHSRAAPSWLLQPPVIAVASDLHFDGRRRRPENRGTSGARRRGPRAAARACPIGRSASGQRHSPAPAAGAPPRPAPPLLYLFLVDW
jgi:hypothetical protein